MVVGSTGGESCDLILVDIKTRYSKFGFRIEQSKRKAHIAQTYHAYPRLVSFDPGFDLRQ